MGLLHPPSPCVHPCQSCALGLPLHLHSVPPLSASLSHFWGEQFSLDRRTGSSEAQTRSGRIYKNAKTFGKCWLTSCRCLCFDRGMHLLSLEVVCTITGFEEAVRRGGGWEHTAAAAAPNSQCARSERRQGDNTDPRAHWGAPNLSSLLSPLFFKPLCRVASPQSTADFIDWSRPNWLRDEGKWFDLQTQPWRLRRNSERTRR